MNEKELKIGVQAPEFSLPDNDNKIYKLNDLKGKWVVLYFYPKDNTPGCTLEAKDFTEKIKEFEKRNAIIIGVSPDSPKSHCNFIEKHNLSVKLLSDENHSVLEKYGVWQLKKRYGREYYGVERSTFLINPEGKISYLWRSVNVQGHAEEVLKKLDSLTH